MYKKSWKSLLLAAVTIVASAGSLAHNAQAQDAANYPEQTIRLVVPYAPGGASDFLARIAAPKMSALLGQQIVVDNRSGGAGNFGMDIAARAAPDGYTLFLGDIGAVALNPHVYADMTVKPLEDFIPVSVMTETPLLLVAHPDVPAANVEELVTHVKANPGKLSFASPGSSTLDRLVMERFRSLAGMELNHVPYGGGAGPAAADVIGGHVQLMFGTISSTLPHVQTGKLKALAVSTSERTPALPDTPTVGDLGYGDATGVAWQGLFVQTGTPQAIVDKLHAAVVEVMNDPEVKSRIAERGGKAVSNDSPASFLKYIQDDEAKWAAVIQEVGIKAD
ncbi:MAG: tripartite tricarboxylate transporter substrate binding protein [Pseudaminobacter sp.]